MSRDPHVHGILLGGRPAPPTSALSYVVHCMYTSHDQAHADKSIPRFFRFAARLILLPKKARRAIWPGLLPPEVCALLALLPTCAVYCVQLLL